MSSKKTQPAIEKELIKQTRALTKEVQNLKNLEFVKILKHPWKFMLFSFLKGLMIGFGSVLGASVLVGFFIYVLAQISFVPILGDLVEDIMEQIGIEAPVDYKNGQEKSISEQFNKAKENIENKQPSIGDSTPATPN